MKKIPFLVQALREAMQKSFEAQTKSAENLNSILKGREVIVNNQKYENYKATIDQYYFDCGKEYLRLSHKSAYDLVEFKDCELV